MEISREDKEIKEIVEMPNVTGITYYEAKKLLKEAGIETNSILEAETIITDQVPKAGIKINNGTKVILYGE